MKLHPRRALRHRLHPRRPGARPVDRRDHHADLPDLDLRAGGAGPAQGLRVRAHAATRRAPRSKPTSRRSRAARPASRSPRAWPPSAPSRRCSRPATTSSSPTTRTAARTACSSKVLTRYGLSFTYVDTVDLDAVERAIEPATRMLFVETPTNPMMRLTDIAALRPLAHAPRRCALVVDNTFASPTSSGRSRSAPTSSSTARRST